MSKETIVGLVETMSPVIKEEVMAKVSGKVSLMPDEKTDIFGCTNLYFAWVHLSDLSARSCYLPGTNSHTVEDHFIKIIEEFLGPNPISNVGLGIKLLWWQRKDHLDCWKKKPLNYSMSTSISAS